MTYRYASFFLWGPVISGVLLRLYGMGLRPNDPIWGHWQVRGWSANVITGMVLTEELKVIMVIPKLSEVKSHLGTFVWGGLKPSYPSEYSFKCDLMTGSRILDKGWGRRKTNIYKSYCLHNKCCPANSLAALMWKWYLNSERAAIQLVVESAGRCEMGQESTPRIKFTRVW